MKVRHTWLIGAVLLVATAVILALLAPGGQDSLAAGVTIYVDFDAGGADNGSTWANAFTDLQSALDAAVAGDEIWVAAGVYTPTLETDPGDPRSATFQMKNGVALYGGFDPDAGDIAWQHRDWEANPTILSGDLNGDDGPEFANNEENSYHVFFHPDGTELDATAVLDGFTITGGNAGGTYPPHVYGGGMHNDGSSPTLNHCTFAANSGDHGGGMYNFESSSPVLDHCTFSGNSAKGDGGGIFNVFNSAPTLVDCTFENNSASRGGGMYGLFSSPVLTACTFKGNYAAEYGGGMVNWSSSPTLINCTFSGNWADDGGGIFNDRSAAALTGCSFADNSAVSEGGGMYNSGGSPALTGCTFEGNSADISGGGVYNVGSSPTLADCTFTGNSAPNGGGMFNSDASPSLTDCVFSGNSGGGGGGMNNQLSSAPVLTNCIFENNSAASGGGMRNSDSTPVIAACTFKGNSADFYGGGMYNRNASPVLTNCIFAYNSASSWESSVGGGMYNVESSPSLTNCTFTHNSADLAGGGMRNYESSPMLTNCILWEDASPEIADYDSSPVVTYSDVQGGYEGEGNIDADPFFVDPTSGDYHLLLGSPCIDAGNNDAPYLPAYDFEGDNRILDGDGNVTAIVDMGVDELSIDWPYSHVYLPLVLGAN